MKTIELSDEELMICDALITEAMDIDDKFVLLRDPNKARLKIDKLNELETRLRKIDDER